MPMSTRAGLSQFFFGNTEYGWDPTTLARPSPGDWWSPSWRQVLSCFPPGLGHPLAHRLHTSGQPGTLPVTPVQHSHGGASTIGSWWSVYLGFPSALGRFPVGPHSCPWASLPPAPLPWSPLVPLACYPKAYKSFLPFLSSSVSAFHPQWWGSPNPDGS